MGLDLLFGVALFGASVQGLAFPSPSPTDNTYSLQEDGWTPMPTAPPGVHEVLRRQKDLASTYLMAPDNTCGFVSGKSNAAYTCAGAKLRCAFIPASSKVPGAAGCCDGSDCSFRVSCVDNEDIKKSCDKDCLADSLTLKCTGSAKFCNTVAFPLGVTDYYCATRRDGRVQKAETTYRGQKGRTMVPTVMGATTSTSRSSSTSSKSSSASSSELSSSSSPSSSLTSAASTQTDSARADAATSSAEPTPAPAPSASAGAIVGGVIGGLALLALIILGAIFLRQRQAKQLQAMSAAPPTGLQGQQPMTEPPFPSQPPAGPFAERSSAYSAQTYGAAAAAAAATSAAGAGAAAAGNSSSSNFNGATTGAYADRPTPIASPQPVRPAYHPHHQHQQQPYDQQQQQQPQHPAWMDPGMALPDRSDAGTPLSVRNAEPVTPVSALSSQPAFDRPSSGSINNISSAASGSGSVPLVLQPGMGAGAWEHRYRAASSSSVSVVNGRPIIPYSPAVREQQRQQQQQQVQQGRGPGMLHETGEEGLGLRGTEAGVGTGLGAAVKQPSPPPPHQGGAGAGAGAAAAAMGHDGPVELP